MDWHSTTRAKLLFEVGSRPFSIMLAFFSAFFRKTSIFFSFFLEKELLAFSVIFHDCDPDFSTQKGVFNPESLIQ